MDARNKELNPPSASSNTPVGDTKFVAVETASPVTVVGPINQVQYNHGAIINNAIYITPSATSQNDNTDKKRSSFSVKLIGITFKPENFIAHERITELEDHIKNGAKSVAVIGPRGAGKSEVAMDVVRKSNLEYCRVLNFRNEKTLQTSVRFLAKELLDLETLIKFGKEIDVNSAVDNVKLFIVPNLNQHKSWVIVLDNGNRRMSEKMSYIKDLLTAVSNGSGVVIVTTSDINFKCDRSVDMTDGFPKFEDASQFLVNIIGYPLNVEFIRNIHALFGYLPLALIKVAACIKSYMANGGFHTSQIDAVCEKFYADIKKDILILEQNPQYYDITDDFDDTIPSIAITVLSRNTIDQTLKDLVRVNKQLAVLYAISLILYALLDNRYISKGLLDKFLRKFYPSLTPVFLDSIISCSIMNGHIQKENIIAPNDQYYRMHGFNQILIFSMSNYLINKIQELNYELCLIKETVNMTLFLNGILTVINNETTFSVEIGQYFDFVPENFTRNEPFLINHIERIIMLADKFSFKEKVIVDTLNICAAYYRLNGNLSESQAMCEKAELLCTQTNGKMSLSYAITLYNFSRFISINTSGDTKKAKTQMKRACTIVKGLGGSDSYFYWNFIDKLAGTFYWRFRYYAHNGNAAKAKKNSEKARCHYEECYNKLHDKIYAKLSKDIKPGYYELALYSAICTDLATLLISMKAVPDKSELRKQALDKVAEAKKLCPNNCLSYTWVLSVYARANAKMARLNPNDTDRVNQSRDAYLQICSPIIKQEKPSGILTPFYYITALYRLAKLTFKYDPINLSASLMYLAQHDKLVQQHSGIDNYKLKKSAELRDKINLSVTNQRPK